MYDQSRILAAELQDIENKGVSNNDDIPGVLRSKAHLGHFSIVDGGFPCSSEHRLAAYVSNLADSRQVARPAGPG